MINGKKAFQLSVNFIVVLIMAIAVFSVGIYLIYTTLIIVEEKRAQLDAQTEAQIESMLAGGEKVAIPIQKKMIDKGSAVFGLGVLNIENQDYENDFEVKIGCISKYNVDGSVDPNGCSDTSPWFGCGKHKCETALENNRFSLRANEDRIMYILISITDPSTGLYAFKVVVEKEGEEYPPPQVIYVEVL